MQPFVTYRFKSMNSSTLNNNLKHSEQQLKKSVQAGFPLVRLFDRVLPL